MIAELAHCSSFAADTGSGSVIQFLCLDEGKGHISVKESVMGKVDLLLTTLTQEFLHLVTPIGEGDELR
jgi:hypothetical protein